MAQITALKLLEVAEYILDYLQEDVTVYKIEFPKYEHTLNIGLTCH